MDDGNEKCPFVDSNVCIVTNTTWMMVILCLPQEKCPFVDGNVCTVTNTTWMMVMRSVPLLTVMCAQ